MMKRKKTMKEGLLFAAALLLLLTACQKEPSAGETSEAAGNTREESGEVSNPDSSERDPEKNGTDQSSGGKETTEPEDPSKEETPTEQTLDPGSKEEQTETETQTEPSQVVRVPDGWNLGTPATLLYRRLERSDFEKKELLPGLTSYTPPKGAVEHYVSGDEVCYYKTQDEMQMVYRRPDGSGIIITLPGNLHSMSFLLKGYVEEEDPKNGRKYPRTILQEVEGMHPMAFSFWMYYDKYKYLRTIPREDLPIYYLFWGIRDDVPIKCWFDFYLCTEEEFEELASDPEILDALSQMKERDLEDLDCLESLSNGFIKCHTEVLERLGIDWEQLEFSEEYFLAESDPADSGFEEFYWNYRTYMEMYASQSSGQEEESVPNGSVSPGWFVLELEGQAPSEFDFDGQRFVFDHYDESGRAYYAPVWDEDETEPDEYVVIIQD